jgi:serine/threonine-protein kinase RsbW
MSAAGRTTALDRSYPAQPSQVPAIRRVVADAARIFGAGESTLMQINLAVTEAATNAILHAYRGGGLAEAGDVRVAVWVDEEGCLDVRVRDRGVGLSQRPDSPGLGLGLGLIAHETECFEVHTTPDGGTEVVLRFRL